MAYAKNAELARIVNQAPMPNSFRYAVELKAKELELLPAVIVEPDGRRGTETARALLHYSLAPVNAVKDVQYLEDLDKMVKPEFSQEFEQTHARVDADGTVFLGRVSLHDNENGDAHTVTCLTVFPSRELAMRIVDYRLHGDGKNEVLNKIAQGVMTRDQWSAHAHNPSEFVVGL